MSTCSEPRSLRPCTELITRVWRRRNLKLLTTEDLTQRPGLSRGGTLPELLRPREAAHIGAGKNIERLRNNIFHLDCYSVRS